MANNSTIAHRFANRDYNFERGLKGSSTHISGKNYYSYSTVFGQWVDKNVCVIYNGSTSVSSSKHQLGSWDFPKNVTLLPYDDGGRSGYYGSWHGCNLLGYSNEFTYEHRVKLIDYYVQTMYNALAAINGGKKKDLDLFAARTLEENWGYIMKLCAMYRDTTVSKWLRIKGRTTTEWKQKKTMVRLRDEGEPKLRHYVDAMFGEGTWEKYYNYCERYRKSADKRAQMTQLCNRLGIKNPYEGWQGYGVLSHEMSAADIRRLTAKERNDYHFASIMHKEWRDGENARNEKYNRNNRNAYAWIVGCEPKTDSIWSDRISKSCKKVRNMYTGDEYIVAEDSYRSHFNLWGLKLNVYFDYDEFRKSEDKEEWIRNFYAECIEVDRNLRALNIFDRFRDAVYTDQTIDFHTYRVYVINDVLREGTTEEELKICEDFVNRWNAILHDKEARYRAEQIERERRMEEERKEKELREQLKQEQIDECLKRGLEGRRDLWRKHYMEIYEAESYNDSRDDSEFFFGGNVLMRFSMNKDKVETSKSIRVNIPTCKLMWKLVSKWHENPSSFKPMQIKTLDGTYTISSYENDILTAGCHDIAYAEMERMYNEIIANEDAA